MALKLPFQPPPIGPRARTVLRYVGFAVVGVVTFVIALQLSFPFNRVKAKVVEALSEKYEVTIGDVEGGIMPGRVYFKAVTLRTRPTAPGEVATTFYIEQLRLDVGLFALLRGTMALDLDAKIGPGHIKGDIDVSPSGTSVDIVGDDLPSASLPVREALGLPMSGKVRFNLVLDLPNERAGTKAGKAGPNWLKANGSLELACPSGCTIGDGKTKLRPKLKNQRNQVMVEGGIDFGKVNIDSLLARVEIKNGKLDVTKFDTKSTEGELRVDFNMALNQDLNASVVTGCLRFRGSDALLKREAKTHAAISTIGGALGPDNLFHVKVEGTIRDLRVIGRVCGPGTNSDGTTTPPARPNLSNIPEPPPHNPNLGTPPTPTPTPIPPSSGFTPGSLQGTVVPTMPPTGTTPPQPVTPPPSDNPGTVVPSVPIEPQPHLPGEVQQQPHQQGEVPHQPGEVPQAPPTVTPGALQ